MRPSEARARRRGSWPILVVLLLLAGCTRVVEDARPQREPTVGPIAANQVEDLVRQTGRGGDEASSLFDSVTPTDCAPLLQEIGAPFVFDAGPVAHTSSYFFDETHQPPFNIVEIAGVYHSDYDSLATVEKARRTIEVCSRDVVRGSDSDGARYDYDVRPGTDAGSTHIVLWSLTDTTGWSCDDALVAAYNAAVEITTCGLAHGYDAVTQAQDVLKRIERLANATT